MTALGRDLLVCDLGLAGATREVVGQAAGSLEHRALPDAEVQERDEKSHVGAGDPTEHRSDDHADGRDGRHARPASAPCRAGWRRPRQNVAAASTGRQSAVRASRPMIQTKAAIREGLTEDRP